MKIGIQTWGSEGDIQPFTALAAGLVERGHIVKLVVTDNIGRDYSHLGKRLGYEIVPVPNPLVATEAEAIKIWQDILDSGNPIRQARLVIKYGFDPAIENMLAAAHELCDWADMVIGHFFVYPLQIAAEKKDRPRATVNIVHNCVPSTEIQPPGIPDIGKWFRPLGWKLVQFSLNRLLLSKVNELRKKEGLTRQEDLLENTWASPQLNLIAVSSEICKRPADWPSQHQVSGFLNTPDSSALEEIPGVIESFLRKGAAPIYMTFGSMMMPHLSSILDTYRLWIEAVKELGLRAIMQIPWSDLSVFDHPSNVLIVNRAPYLKVFPRCAAVIHHGGAGTTHSAILSGAPSLIVAHVADQFFWGSELERLGVACVTLKRMGLSSKRLAHAIQQTLSDSSLSLNAQRLGEKMRGESGLKRAIDLIEQNFSQMRP